jgi:hypothetical protein
MSLIVVILFKTSLNVSGVPCPSSGDTVIYYNNNNNNNVLTFWLRRSFEGNRPRWEDNIEV